MTGGNFTLLLMGALGCLLLAAAFTDLKGRTIEHWTTGAIALLAPLYWWSSGYALWPDVPIQIGIALAVFAVFAAIYTTGAMGGGDVKLLAALALWLPAAPLFTMLFVMAIAGGLISLFFYAVHKLRKNPENLEIPYGVAIAISGLWVMSERYFNQFA